MKKINVLLVLAFAVLLAGCGNNIQPTEEVVIDTGAIAEETTMDADIQETTEDMEEDDATDTTMSGDIEVNAEADAMVAEEAADEITKIVDEVVEEVAGN